MSKISETSRFLSRPVTDLFILAGHDVWDTEVRKNDSTDVEYLHSVHDQQTSDQSTHDHAHTLIIIVSLMARQHRHQATLLPHSPDPAPGPCTSLQRTSVARSPAIPNAHLYSILHVIMILFLCHDSDSTSGPVSTWMGDRLRAGKPSRYVTSHPGQLSLPSLRGR